MKKKSINFYSFILIKDFAAGITLKQPSAKVWYRSSNPESVSAEREGKKKAEKVEEEKKEMLTSHEEEDRELEKRDEQKREYS